MLTVNELRQQGYDVRVRHNRCFQYVQKLNGDYETRYLSKGGSTEVIVARYVSKPNSPDPGLGTFSFVGVAECSPKENFNRKRGVRIALGRALKQMGMCTK